MLEFVFDHDGAAIVDRGQGIDCKMPSRLLADSFPCLPPDCNPPGGRDGGSCSPASLPGIL